MIKVLKCYKVNEQTVALLPAFHASYCTIVWEIDRILYVEQTPLQIITSSCLHSGASYDGRRSAVIHLTGLKKKVPIPINPENNIYAFPSHSGNHKLCHWLFFNHIVSIEEVSPFKDPEYRSMVVFTNDQKLMMRLTTRVLQMQLYRTSECIRKFRPFIGQNEKLL